MRRILTLSTVVAAILMTGPARDTRAAPLTGTWERPFFLFSETQVVEIVQTGAVFTVTEISPGTVYAEPLTGVTLAGVYYATVDTILGPYDDLGVVLPGELMVGVTVLPPFGIFTDPIPVFYIGYRIPGGVAVIVTEGRDAGDGTG